MTNNDILRRLKSALDLNPQKLIAIYQGVGIQYTEEKMKEWLQKPTEDGEVVLMLDAELAQFLNGLIIHYRGIKDGEIPIVETVLTNNIIFRKLRIALNFKDTDIIEVLNLADFKIGKSEINAFFRQENHQNYRKCLDQVLRNFINGVYLKNHPSKTKR